MNKAADLRRHLSESVPQLAANPEKLKIYIDRGAIASRHGGGLSFEYRYDLTIGIEDFTAHADTLVIPLLAWIAVQQPAILLAAESIDKALTFKAELVDHDKADLEITLPLTEAVIVAARPDGGYLATHIPEPPLPDVGGPRGWEIFINGVPLVAP